MSQKSQSARDVREQLVRRFGRKLGRKFKQLVLLVVSLLSCESFATQVDALQRVISYPQLALTIPLISKVEVVSAYHCPDCYDIRITGFDNTAKVKMNFRTRINSRHELEAMLLDTARMP